MAHLRVSMSDTKAAGRTSAHGLAAGVDQPFLGAELSRRQPAATTSGSGGREDAGGGSGALDVTRAHWVPNADRTHCAQCSKDLAGRMGPRKHHCRRCGEIFCESCVSFSRRLSPEAQIDPGGVLSRVCEGCYGIQVGSERGAVEDLMDEFQTARKAAAQNRSKEDKLLKQLAKLRRLMQEAGVAADSVSDRSKEERFYVTPEPWEREKRDAVCSEVRAPKLPIVGFAAGVKKQLLLAMGPGRAFPCGLRGGGVECLCSLYAWHAVQCFTPFGMTGRKHRCRLSGELFCNQHSARTPLDIVEMDRMSAPGSDEASPRGGGGDVFKKAQPWGTVWISRTTEGELQHARDRIQLHASCSGGVAGFGDGQQTANDRVYMPLMELQNKIDLSLTQFTGLVMSYDMGAKGDTKQVAKLHHDLDELLRRYKRSYVTVSDENRLRDLCPRGSSERVRNVTKMVARAVGDWYANTFFSFKAFRRDLYKYVPEQVLEDIHRLSNQRLMGAVYGLIMQLLWQWDEHRDIKDLIKGEETFELCNGRELTTTEDIVESVRAMETEVQRSFQEAEEEWQCAHGCEADCNCYYSKFRALTRKPLGNKYLILPYMQGQSLSEEDKTRLRNRIADIVQDAEQELLTEIPLAKTERTVEVLQLLRRKATPGLGV
eukprot:COSAG01_NODE_3589_length_5901_cov_11.324143_2_plen_657_part_00